MSDNRKRWEKIPRCKKRGCVGAKPSGKSTGIPRPVYADGLCYSHYQEVAR